MAEAIEDEPNSGDGAKTIARVAVDWDPGVAERRLVASLCKAVLSLVDNSVDGCFVASDRVMFARDMAVVALLERLGRVARSDLPGDDVEGEPCKST